MPDYSLPMTENARISGAKAWLLTGALALGLAGLFAGIMVSNKAIFHTALVVHVDLSVLVWFLGILGMLCALAGQTRTIPYVNGAAFWCFFIGMLCLPASAYIGTGEALMNNYVPVITKPLFFLGLSLLLTGTLLVISSLLFSPPIKNLSMAHMFSPYGIAHEAQFFGVFSAALITLVAIACTVWAHNLIPPVIIGEQYYELLFWGGGHVLQFTHTQLVMVVWLWLASVVGLRLPIKPRHVAMLYVIGLLAALAAPMAYVLHDITSAHHRDFFTQMMKHGNGVAPAILMIALFIALIKKRGLLHTEHRAALSALVASLILFAVGGLVGYRISGSDVTVPAHYHGSIVGVTLAYMGLAYVLLPAFGFAAVTRSWMATLQPLIYMLGQLSWITGMIMLGGYDVARKQENLLDTASEISRVAFFLKHGGDGLSLIGGLLFVVVVARSVIASRRSK